MVLLRRSFVLESKNLNVVVGDVVVYVKKFIRSGQSFTRI